MECDICHRGHDAQRLPFLCTVDARNVIYEGRIKNLQLLIQNDGLQDQINAMLNGTNTPASETLDTISTQQQIVQDQTDKIIAAADRLRDELTAARAEIQARKATLSRRKSDLAAVSQGLTERRARQQKDVENATQITTYRWTDSEEDLARTRSFLCAEAARLYGLKRVRKGPSGRYEYHLGKVPVVDLMSMNTLAPEVISTSLGHISHILMLAAHYLAIRLPAEITLPHRDYPNSTIFTLASSYKHGEISFPLAPGATNLSAEPRSPDSRHVPRPRPLFVDKPLPQLSKEDPTTYSYFVEGVTLLAYDIAWLCSSQGVSVGEKTSFDDICNMGRNLYSLLISQQPNGHNEITPNLINKPPQPEDQNNIHPPSIGHYSHGTMYKFLGSAEGTELIKSFKLPSPVKLADKLKKKLLGDAPAPDWEVLEDDEWKVEDTRGAGPNTSKDSPGMAKSPDSADSPRSGSNGWMKLKNR